MKSLLILAILLISVNSYAKLVVAVIDTGLDRSVVDLSQKPSDDWYSNGICKYGHKDFTTTGLHDRHGHGTNVSGLIHKYAKGNNYCQVIIKFYDPTARNNSNLLNMISAIKHAVKLEVDIINISAGGEEASEEEKEAIKEALEKGIKIIAAAGNGGYSLDTKGYYPATYDERIITVSSKANNNTRLPTSNYSENFVDYEEYGHEQVGEYGKPMTGTSQATAITTGKEISRIFKRIRGFLLQLAAKGKGLG